MLSLTIVALLVASKVSALPQWGWPGWPGWGPPPPPSPPSSGGGSPVTNTVDLGYSTYQGLTLEPAGVLQWLGIAFAAPPTGNLRWRAPADPPPVPGIQPADAFKPTCLGYFGPNVVSPTVNEDCLYLDVFAPANATTESKLPVWFFIQGGGYGGDTDENFDFTEVVMRSGFGLVAVQINYRVGAFGFLASEKIREDGDLNVGLLDQRKAMHWVQEYIHLFGGDPDHVVIHGDSAGAGSVAFHMTAYGGRNDGLFIGGMAESPFWPTHRTVPQMEFQFERLAQNVSCDPNEPDVLACLRSKDTATIQASDVTSRFPNGPSTPIPEWYFLPVVDGTFSTDFLYNLFEQGKVVPVPLVVGDDTDEGTGFAINANTSTDFLDFIAANYPLLSKATLQEILATYPEDGFGTFAKHGPWFPATEAAYGENTFICPGIEMANSLSQYNAPAKVWQYRYNVLDQTNVAAGLGVPHVSEKPAIYGPNNAGPCGDPCSYETYNKNIVPVLMSYWISFILSLDPNTYKVEQAPEWEPWQVQSGGWGGWWPWGYGQGQSNAQVQRLLLQTNASKMETVPSAQLQRCEFWKSLADITEQ